MIENRRTSIREIDSAYKKQREQELALQQKKRRGLIKRLSAIGIVGGAFATIAFMFIFNQHSTLAEKQEEKLTLENEVQQLLTEEKKLQQDIINYNDIDYIEEIARRDYFLTKEGETLFTLPSKSTD
ncbi:cell division protein DivIC [Bacillus sp. TS-2]|nr:cell division protein DivIC [Bacillus sp. TS-2]